MLRRTIMQSHANSYAATGSTGWAFRQVRDQVRQPGAHIVEYIDAHADANAAAALYAELSRLSDAELKRRGIPRGDLDRFVFETLDQATSLRGPVRSSAGRLSPLRNER